MGQTRGGGWGGVSSSQLLHTQLQWQIKVTVPEPKPANGPLSSTNMKDGALIEEIQTNSDKYEQTDHLIQALFATASEYLMAHFRPLMLLKASRTRSCNLPPRLRKPALQTT